MSNRPEVKVEGGEATFEGRTPDAVLEAVKFAFTLADWDMPVRVKMWSAGSTLDYKALLHIWFRSMAEQFTARDKNGTTYTEQDMHDLMCHQFFGYTEGRQIGSKTKLQPALITITYPRQKERPELYQFCRQIEEWCQKVGVTLPDKPSQYEQDKVKEAA